jgi:hypothetical protein
MKILLFISIILIVAISIAKFSSRKNVFTYEVDNISTNNKNFRNSLSIDIGEKAFTQEKDSPQIVFFFFFLKFFKINFKIANCKKISYFTK